MKILCTGDWHIRASAPQYRTDDYYNVQKEKILWLLDLAYRENCSLILQPGDFFDSHTVPNHVVADYIGLTTLNKYNIIIHTIFGQHDMRYRRKENTALGILIACKAVTVENTLYPGVIIYHCGWEEEIPKPSGHGKNINILLIHKMIVQDSPLWHGQEGYITADNFLRNHPEYDLVVSGDNHSSFLVNTNGQTLINCGSLMRSTISQVEHRPVVYIYDTKSMKITKHFIPIKPINSVMNLDLVEETKERNLKLEAFMERLDRNNNTVLDFEENTLQLLKNKEIKSEVEGLVKEILGRYHEVNQ